MIQRNKTFVETNMNKFNQLIREKNEKFIYRFAARLKNYEQYILHI